MDGKGKACKMMEEAFSEENTEKMKMLIEKHGVQIFHNVKRNGLTIYHWFVVDNHMDFVAYLLDKGWDVNQKDTEGDNALYYAVIKNHIDMVKMLIKKGIEINGKGVEGYTPLLFAIVNGCYRCGEILFRKGADANITCKNGDTIFTYFNKRAWEHWLPILLEQPERLNEENLKIVRTKRLELLYR